MLIEETKNAADRCLRCLSGRLKSWRELSADERFFALRLPASAEFTAAERERHLFCPNCWYETKPRAVIV